MTTFLGTAHSVLGIGVDSRSLTLSQTSVRAIVVFVVALVMVRLADKRFLSKKTAFDAILGFILASMLARAINGSSALFPTLGAGFVLVGLHRLIAWLSRDSHWFGNLVKGRCDLVVREGVVIETAMRRNNLSGHDLVEDLRLNGNVEDPRQVKAAYIERNGQITVVR